MNIAQSGLVFVIRIYQWAVSPVLLAALGPAGRCRFTQSCSEYARQAIGLHGVIRGGFLAGRRLCRCHPWGEFGADPVPKPSFPNPNLDLNPPLRGPDKIRIKIMRESQKAGTFSKCLKRGHCHGS